MLKTLSSIVTIFLIAVIFLSSLKISGQENRAAQVSLRTYLNQLEETFSVKFSFADNTINAFSIVPQEFNKLEAAIHYIETEISLDLKKIDNRYYTISKKVISICAKVLDNFEQNTLHNATIKVLEQGITTITDDTGAFYLSNIPKSSILEIRHVGFKPLFIKAEELDQEGPCQIIALAQNIQQLDEVIIYKFLTTGLEKQDDASIVLHTDNFGILPGLIEPDVLQTVQALPGIKSIDETVSDINVRGGTNDQNLILWEGIKMYQSGHFFGLISAFNPYLTDKVTLIKNGSSAAYGDGVSSILDMRTKNTITDELYGGAGINLLSGDVYGQIPLKENLAFQFSGRRSITDLLNTPTYNQFYERAFQDTEIKGNEPEQENIARSEDFYFYDFTGKLLYDISQKHKARVSFIAINNLLEYTVLNTNTQETTNSKLMQTNFSIGGYLESTWNSNFSTQLNAYYTSYHLDSENFNSENDQQLLQNNEVLETAIQLTSNYHFSEQLAWKNGYDFKEVGIINFTNVTQPPFRSNIKGVIRTHALFSELTYASENKKLWARAGLRANYAENLGTFEKLILEPRLNLNYKLARNLKVDLQGEFKNQTTNQVIDLKQNFLGIEKRRWVLANEEDLPITRSKQVSLGVNYDKNKIYIGIEGFYKYVNGISTTTQGFQNEDQFNGEIGTYAARGVEFLINHKTKNLSNWLTYTYNKNDYTFDLLNPSTFPNNLDIRHTITFASTYTYEHLKLGLGLNHRTGRPYTKPQENGNAINTLVFPNTINYEDANNSRLPAYLRIDASAIYNFKINQNIKASVGASLLNILDHKNILNRYYRLNDQDEIETVESVSLGITPNFSFRMFF
ncbi:TonB-dependent receptor [Cellulophaga baltica]|uniref:Outer membrane receptor proteins, mostly Fe transport n=1 Tax=Cellulophaga baltica TaxID=76594 RepID=A0A1G7EH54_9FLAO|nr:carboxypeptidase-like regulatory domain-containing protein [Cellulophaga baltica]SDE62992.1 Outer membrane receptor proteins, mostly Fe transport [Cellulophaga baltica]